jgi:hypothetical protein
MNDPEAVREALRLARAGLAGQMDLLEVCARLAPLHWRLPEVPQDVMDTFVGVGSEVDGKPITADVRTLWNPEALAHKDVGLARYRSSVEEEVKQSLSALLQQFADV